MTSLDHLSMQLYSARKFPPLSEQCAFLASLGFTKVEPFGGLLENPDELAGALEANRLSAPTSHIGIDMLEGDFESAVETATRLGIKTLLVPAIPADQRPADASGWQEFGRRLGAIQGRLAPRGIEFAWHNHDFEFTRTPDGAFPMDLILAAAPDLGWEADIGWIERAGQSAAAWITRYADRIIAFHVKDIAPAGENEDEDGWADVGDGTLDWAALLPTMQSARGHLFVLEHDNPSDFSRFATRSRDAIAAW